MREQCGGLELAISVKSPQEDWMQVPMHKRKITEYSVISANNRKGNFNGIHT